MAPALPRSSFNSSSFIRCLADLHIAAVPGSKQGFAERLSQWLVWTDAIALSTALAAGTGARLLDGRPGAATATAALREELARVRDALADAITSDELLAAAPTVSVSPLAAPPSLQPSQPPAAPAAGAGSAIDFAAYRRSYIAHQRAMDAAIAELRTQVRAALSRLSPELSRLAALDGVLDDALLARERHLLASVPGLLEQHAAQLGEPPSPAWQTACGQHLQRVLLAELDLRLQPVVGMIETIGHEADTQP